MLLLSISAAIQKVPLDEEITLEMALKVKNVTKEKGQSHIFVNQSTVEKLLVKYNYTVNDFINSMIDGPEVKFLNADNFLKTLEIFGNGITAETDHDAYRFVYDHNLTQKLDQMNQYFANFFEIFQENLNSLKTAAKLNKTVDIYSFSDNDYTSYLELYNEIWSISSKINTIFGYTASGFTNKLIQLPQTSIINVGGKQYVLELNEFLKSNSLDEVIKQSIKTDNEVSSFKSFYTTDYKMAQLDFDEIQNYLKTNSKDEIYTTNGAVGIIYNNTLIFNESTSLKKYIENSINKITQLVHLNSSNIADWLEDSCVNSYLLDPQLLYFLSGNLSLESAATSKHFYSICSKSGLSKNDLEALNLKNLQSLALDNPVSLTAGSMLIDCLNSDRLYYSPDQQVSNFSIDFMKQVMKGSVSSISESKKMVKLLKLIYENHIFNAEKMKNFLTNPGTYDDSDVSYTYNTSTYNTLKASKHDFYRNAAKEYFDLFNRIQADAYFLNPYGTNLMPNLGSIVKYFAGNQFQFLTEKCDKTIQNELKPFHASHEALISLNTSYKARIPEFLKICQLFDSGQVFTMKISVDDEIDPFLALLQNYFSKSCTSLSNNKTINYLQMKASSYYELNNIHDKLLKILKNHKIGEAVEFYNKHQSFASMYLDPGNLASLIGQKWINVEYFGNFTKIQKTFKAELYLNPFTPYIVTSKYTGFYEPDITEIIPFFVFPFSQNLDAESVSHLLKIVLPVILVSIIVVCALVIFCIKKRNFPQNNRAASLPLI